MFWKFKARNTLRLMQLHQNRRKRILHAFAFQRFRVQAMRATVHKVISAKFEMQNGVQILNTSALSRQDQVDL